MKILNSSKAIRSVYVLFLCTMMVVFIYIVLRLFFFSLDKNATFDDTKKFEKRGGVFLEKFVNNSINGCRLSVVNFEHLVHVNYGAKVHWDEKNNTWYHGAFGIKVTKENSCIKKINFAWTP